ncbi:g6665 [Coccomyxa elongata]
MDLWAERGLSSWSGVEAGITGIPGVEVQKLQAAGLRSLLQRRRRRRGKGQDEAWLQHHHQLVKEVEEADKGSGFDVIFYGDSIMESTRGTYMGSSWSDFSPVRDVWLEAFGSKPYVVHTLAIAGDTVQRLLWRMRNGELPKKNHPRVVVVLIGSNDLTSPDCASPGAANRTAAELRGLLVYIHRRLPATQIVAMAVLPKGESWPNKCSTAIAAANARLEAYARANRRWLHFLDVGDKFLTHVDNGEGQQDIVPSLLTADTISPSFYGMRVIVKDLVPLIDSLVAQKPSKQRTAETDRKGDNQASKRLSRRHRAQRRKDMRERAGAKKNKEQDDGFV